MECRAYLWCSSKTIISSRPSFLRSKIPPRRGDSGVCFATFLNTFFSDLLQSELRIEIKSRGISHVLYASFESCIHGVQIDLVRKSSASAETCGQASDRLGFCTLVYRIVWILVQRTRAQECGSGCFNPQPSCSPNCRIITSA